MRRRSSAFQQGLVDGIIFTTARSDSPTFERALAVQTPIVLVNRTVENAECDTVTSDNVSGGRTVGRYFADHGRELAVISGPEAASTSSERVKGFCEVFPVGTAMPVSRLEYADFSHDAGARFCREMLTGDDPPDAIFATNDLTAFGVIDAATQLGVGIPEDLWVVGYDDVDMASWAAFDLPTVRQPSRLMASSDLTSTFVSDRTRHPRYLESFLAATGLHAPSRDGRPMTEPDRRAPRQRTVMGLAEVSIITHSQADAFWTFRRSRLQFAHQMRREAIEPTQHLGRADYVGLLDFPRAVELFWARVEIDIREEMDSSSISDDDIGLPYWELLFQMCDSFEAAESLLLHATTLVESSAWPTTSG